MHKSSIVRVLAGAICLAIAPLLLAGNSSATDIRFAVIGDYGSASAAELEVAAMIGGWSPDFVITTGDNSYGSNPIDLNIGQFYSDYIAAYVGSYGPGAPKNRFFPSLGNHDYTDGGGVSAYFAYFTLPGSGIQSTRSSDNERYFDFLWGPIHFFVINSNIQELDGITSSSTQAQWLQTQLAASSAQWKIVYFHHPPYSSATHGSNATLRWPFEGWGVDAVLGGHDHTYERIMRDDNSDGDSLVYIVNGLGGKSIYSFPTIVAGSAVRYNGNYGAQLCEATDTSLVLRFLSIGTPAGVPQDSIALFKPSMCCTGTTGNVNLLGTVDLSDLSMLISYLTVAPPVPLSCPREANIDNAGIIDLADLSQLIAYLTVVPTPPLPECAAATPAN